MLVRRRWQNVRIVTSLKLMRLIEADGECAADDIWCPAGEATLETTILEHAIGSDCCTSRGWWRWWRRCRVDIELVDAAAELAAVSDTREVTALLVEEFGCWSAFAAPAHCCELEKISR